MRDDISANDILDFLRNDDMIDLAQIQATIMEKRQKQYLDRHPYHPYMGKDGKWYVILYYEGKTRKRIQRSTKKDIEKAIVAYQKELEENPTLEELFNDWNSRRLELNKIGRSSYDRYQQVFKRHYGKFGKRRIRNVMPEEIETFLEDELGKHQLSAKAFSSLKTTTKGILKTAKRQRMIGFNISDLLDDLDVEDADFKQTIKEDYEEVFDEAETATMVTYLLDNLDTKNTAILLMFVTGLRVGELVALKHEDIDGFCIKVRRTETRYSDPDHKGRWVYDIKDFPKTKAGVRNVVIPKDYWFLLTRMSAMNPNGEFIFTYDNGERITTNVIRRRQERLCKQLHIYRKSPHKVRKTVGSIYMDARLDNNLITNQLGWADIKVGERHYHRNRKSDEQKLNLISEISEMKLPRVNFQESDPDLP